MHVKTINLFLPYFPGARQDRVMVAGESLTVKVYANLINDLKLNKVTIFDPHSDVTPALLEKVGNPGTLDSIFAYQTRKLSGYGGHGSHK